MRKRQDLLYSYVYELIYPEKDLIIVDIPVKLDLPLIWALIGKKKTKSMIETTPDLAKLTKAYEIKNLSQNYNLLGESAESIDYLIDNHVVKKVNDFSQLIQYIHYTDQKLFSEQTGHLRAVFYASKKH